MNTIEIKNFEDWNKATPAEKNEYCFLEFKDAIKSNDVEGFRRAFELMFWTTFIDGVTDFAEMKKKNRIERIFWETIGIP